MDRKKVGFLGTGNMAKAILEGAITTGVVSPEEIYASDINVNALEEYTRKISIEMCKTNIELSCKSDVIILSVKPNVLSDVLKEIKGHVDGKLIISIVAGASIEQISDFLGLECRIIRTMPNTPAMVSEGMTILCYGNSVTEMDKQITNSIFQSIGMVEVMEEKYLNSVIALTASSPAYFFMMIEAMADAAVHAGLPRNTSYKLAAQTMLGSAQLLLKTGKHPGELKDMVCSPAGTTIEAVAELERTGFRNSIISAMRECTDKASKLC